MLGEGSWFFGMQVKFECDRYTVYIRQIGDDEYHMAIMSSDGKRIGWAEKQSIKNDIFGNERVAFEVYPKESEKVDEGSVYHLWVIPRNENQRWNLLRCIGGANGE